MGDLGGLSLHTAITPQALWSPGSESAPVPGSGEAAVTLPSRQETDREQEIKATLQTIPENKMHTGKDFNQAKVMERWAGVDLNRDSGKEEGTPDLSPEGGEGADCGRGQGRSPGRDSHGPAALPRGPCSTCGDPASTCLLTKFLHLQPGALWGGGGGVGTQNSS